MNDFNDSSIPRQTGIRQDRTKNRATPKRGIQRAARHQPYPRLESYRPYSHADMIMTGTGWHQVISHRVLSFPAIKDAIHNLDFSDRTQRAELCWLADDRRTSAELLDHCDVFAERFPDDRRWDAWRRYRRTQTAALS